MEATLTIEILGLAVEIHGCPLKCPLAKVYLAPETNNVFYPEILADGNMASTVYCMQF